MAECLEDFAETDRQMDQNDFLANQFEKFTHDYRETTEPACCANPESEEHSNCEKREVEAKKAKKEIVNLTRKLQKALVSLEIMSGSSTVIQDLLKALQTVNQKIRDVIVRQNSEFKATTIPIPEYDTIDMKCLLGDDQVADQKSLVELVKEDQERQNAEMTRLMAEAEILLLEYDHIKNGLKT